MPFYASGLRFSCKRCSACCRYDAGFVYLSENDLSKLASALKMQKNDFISVYCRWVSDWGNDEVLSLKEKSNKDCILWENGCKVYMSRPLQCSTFPFWENILSSTKSWDIAATGCPGINTGDLHTKNVIEENINLRSSRKIIKRVRKAEYKAEMESLRTGGSL